MTYDIFCLEKHKIMGKTSVNNILKLEIKFKFCALVGFQVPCFHCNHNFTKLDPKLAFIS